MSLGNLETSVEDITPSFNQNENHTDIALVTEAIASKPAPKKNKKKRVRKPRPIKDPSKAGRTASQARGSNGRFGKKIDKVLSTDEPTEKNEPNSETHSAIQTPIEVPSPVVTPSKSLNSSFPCFKLVRLNDLSIEDEIQAYSLEQAAILALNSLGYNIVEDASLSISSPNTQDIGVLEDLALSKTLVATLTSSCDKLNEDEDQEIENLWKDAPNSIAFVETDDVSLIGTSNGIAELPENNN
jgi:hypothetical protein